MKPMKLTHNESVVLGVLNQLREDRALETYDISNLTGDHRVFPYMYTDATRRTLKKLLEKGLVSMTKSQGRCYWKLNRAAMEALQGQDTIFRFQRLTERKGLRPTVALLKSDQWKGAEEEVVVQMSPEDFRALVELMERGLQ